MDVKNYLYALMTDRRRSVVDVPVKFLLLLCSLAYGVAVAFTRGLYASGILPSYQSPKSVVSVGNITAGGVGKTPLVIELAKALRERNVRAVILTRGYMAQGGNASDEAGMLNEVLKDVPVLIGANRAANIQTALKSIPVRVFICDDAFQHWPLKRDLDIVLIDTANPFGNGHLLPRGILRESPASLRRAHIFVLTKTDQSKNAYAVRARLHALNPSALIVESRHKPMHLTGAFSNQKLVAIEHRHQAVFDFVNPFTMAVAGFCAVGDPASFAHTLKAAGINAKKIFEFLDHHVYTQQDMSALRRYCQDNHINILVTTHKDAVKIRSFEQFWEGFQIYYIEVELELTQGKDAFIERVLSVIHH